MMTWLLITIILQLQLIGFLVKKSLSSTSLLIYDPVLLYNINGPCMQLNLSQGGVLCTT